MAAAVRQACALDVQLLTMRAAGGAEMVRATARANHSSMKTMAVTVLTSLDDTALEDMGLQTSCAQTTYRLGALAMQAGADDLVCSAEELEALCPLGGLRVVPGVRRSGAQPDDQARTYTTEYAARCGADWLVVGRPITQSGRSVNEVLALNDLMRSDTCTSVATEQPNTLIEIT